jgi:hypothetical protein
MSGADLVRAQGRRDIDPLERRLRSGKLPKSEVRQVIQQWQANKRNFVSAQNMAAAHAAADVIAQLENIESRAD